MATVSHTSFWVLALVLLRARGGDHALQLAGSRCGGRTSTASLMAMPRLPGVSGAVSSILRPACHTGLPSDASVAVVNS